MSIRHLLVHQISFLPPAHSVKLGLNRPPGSSTLIIMVKRSNTPDGQKLLELYLFGSFASILDTLGKNLNRSCIWIFLPSIDAIRNLNNSQKMFRMLEQYSFSADRNHCANALVHPMLKRFFDIVKSDF